MNKAGAPPHYESPLEESFHFNLDKYIARGVRVTPQFEVITFCGTYRLDFLASCEGDRPVGLECDGAEFHDIDRDEWRDALILDATNLKAIYRFQGPSLVYHMEDCLFILAQWERQMFSDRGHINLRRLASKAAKSAAEYATDNIATLHYLIGDPKQPVSATLVRHSLFDSEGFGTYLHRLLDFAKRSGFTDLDTIRERHLASYSQGS